jgi:GNAT superfamily N-acetyltransferase
MVHSFTVRQFCAGDRDSVRRIALSTAFMGGPSSVFFDGDEFFADILTLYFTDFEPESSFVAVRDGVVIGYLVGARDTARMDKVVYGRIFWTLFLRALTAGIIFRRKNLRLMGRVFLSFLRGEFFTPDFHREYPATLHINVLQEARASGVGTSLIQTYLAYLKDNAVGGVRMGTMSETAGMFFKKHGFFMVFQRPRTYFSHLTRQKIAVSVFAKKITI